MGGGVENTGMPVPCSARVKAQVQFSARRMTRFSLSRRLMIPRAREMQSGVLRPPKTIVFQSTPGRHAGADHSSQALDAVGRRCVRLRESRNAAGWGLWCRGLVGSVARFGKPPQKKCNFLRGLDCGRGWQLPARRSFQLSQFLLKPAFLVGQRGETCANGDRLISQGLASVRI